MPHSSLNGLIALAGLAAIGLAAEPARAQLIINPTFDSSITSDPNHAAIEATIGSAISVYETTFTNPITVNITYGEMGGGLGESTTAIVQESYLNVYNALTAKANTANALSAVASLPNQLLSPVDGNTLMWVTTANARALGFGAAVSVDSTVDINTSITNDSSPYNQNGSDYSLLAVVEHETDEALGLGSGLNLPANFPRLSRVQDLFRYSAFGIRSYTTSPDATSYFSVNGGVTDLANFNQNSDGSDYGDWINGDSPPKVQDAYGTPGSNDNLLTDGGVELEALNVQGYTMANGSQSDGTPEPGSLALFIATGIIGTSAGIRRKMAARKS